MLIYTFRRVIGTIPVLLLITLLVFGLLQLAPGDPADILLPEEATHEDIAEARARWGLDKPFHEQYWESGGDRSSTRGRRSPSTSRPAFRRESSIPATNTTS